MATDDKVVIGLTHGLDDQESVLIAYLMGVEALRKDKQVVMWLTKDGVLRCHLDDLHDDQREREEQIAVQGEHPILRWVDIAGRSSIANGGMRQLATGLG